MPTKSRQLASPQNCTSLAIVLVAVLSTASLVAAAPKTPAKKGPSFSEVEKIVHDHFAQIEDYRPGDLITQQPVAELFKLLKLAGWKVADQQAILGQIVADNDFLAQQLRTQRGQQFMRKISGYSGGFDRLDRIAAMPQGKGNVAQMINMPGGYEMIEAMTTTHRGQILGQRLSNAPQGKDFNKPTGRIYTEAALIARLKVSYANRDKAAPSRP